MAQVQASKASLIRADVAVILVCVVFGIGFINLLSTANAPFLADVTISTRLSSLPGYALLSLTRSFLSLFLSIVFAIIYGTLAARSKTWERILIPMLDVLQSLPVIAFLPGFVLALISIFQNSRWGLEFACLLTIFVGQVWNLAFAYYESQRQILSEFKEVATIYKLSNSRKFFILDFPSGYKPLIYNGMMSMAGGWFFLTTCEAFTLGNQNFRLPGLGSYLALTFSDGKFGSFSIGLGVLLIIILSTDFLIWRPLIAWVNQFNEETNKSDQNESFFLNLIRDTNLPEIISKIFRKTLSFLFPRAEIESPGDTRKYLFDNIQKWTNIITPQEFSWKDKITAIKNSSMVSFIVTFAIGGVVFSLLPNLPSFAASLAKISATDWFELMHAVFLTGSKVFLVLIISTLWTVPLGILLGLHRTLEKIAQPIIQNAAAFPAPVLFPLITLLLYRFHLHPYLNSTLLMCVGSQWYILFNVIGAASRIPAELKLVSKIYGFTFWKRFSRFYFPCILPSLITGWITAAGGAWNSSMVAEIIELPNHSIVQSNGIGAEFMKATFSGNYARLVAGIICLVVALILLNRTLWKSLQILSEKVKD